MGCNNRPVMSESKHLRVQLSGPAQESWRRVQGFDFFFLSVEKGRRQASSRLVRKWQPTLQVIQLTTLSDFKHYVQQDNFALLRKYRAGKSCNGFSRSSLAQILKQGMFVSTGVYLFGICKSFHDSRNCCSVVFLDVVSFVLKLSMQFSNKLSELYQNQIVLCSLRYVFFLFTSSLRLKMPFVYLDVSLYFCRVLVRADLSFACLFGVFSFCLV